MPSPFPGMDPFLEELVLWPDVHFGLIVAVSRVLQPLLLPRYYLRVRRRVDYAKEPPAPALTPDDAAWLDGLLREAGLRGVAAK